MGSIVSFLSYYAHKLPGLSSPDQKKIPSPAPQPEPFGTIGTGFFNKKIRILYINGIRNSHADVEESASLIHQIAQSQIEFLHTSLGVTDAYVRTRRIQEAGKMAAKRIRELFSDVENRESELIVITHSAGGLVFKEASSELREEEKRKISLITLGSTYIFPKNFGFQKVVNVLNTRDFLPYPGRFRRTGGEITFVSPEPKQRRWWPIQEHLFAAPAYQKALNCLFQRMQQSCTT